MTRSLLTNDSTLWDLPALTLNADISIRVKAMTLIFHVSLGRKK